jgi:small conductance mechanosensitive channel
MLSFESIYPVIYVAITLALTYIATKIVILFIRGIFRSGIPIVAIHVEKIATVVIWVIGVLIALETVGVRMDLILLLFALAGLAAILAFRDVLGNLVARYFSELYVPFKLGDEITVLNYTGKVIGVNPICTILLTKEENIISIPNQIFMKEPIINSTPIAWKELIVPIIVPTSIDLAEFEENVLKACNKLKMYWDENFPPLLTTKRRDEKEVHLELRLMVKEPEKKEVAATEINRRILEILQKLKSKSRQKPSQQS